METEFGTDLGRETEVFSQRIDELLASALEDQAREQKMMIDTVHAARAALSAAQGDLVELRRLVEKRDREVIDLLEARLAGVASQETIDQVVLKMEPMSHVASEVAERLERMTSPLESVREAIDRLSEGIEATLERSAEEARRLADRVDQGETRVMSSVERVESMAGALGEGLEASRREMKGVFEDLLSSIAQAQEAIDSSADRVIRTQGATLQTGVDTVTANLAEVATLLGATRNELNSMLLDAKSEMASEMSKAGEKLVERIDEASLRMVDETANASTRMIEETSSATGELALVRDELKLDMQNFSARMFDRMQKVREEVESFEKLLHQLPTLIDEHLVAHRESVQASNAVVSRQVEQARQQVARMDQTIAAQFNKLGELLEERVTAVEDRLARRTNDSAVSINEHLTTLQGEIHAALIEVKETLDSQAPSLGETVDSALVPFSQEMVRLSERVRQTNRRITESNSRMESMQGSLVSYLAQRDERMELTRDALLADLIHQIGLQLKRRDRVRIGDALKEADLRRRDKRDAERWRKQRDSSKEAGPPNASNEHRLDELLHEVPEGEPIADADPGEIPGGSQRGNGVARAKKIRVGESPREGASKASGAKAPKSPPRKRPSNKAKRSR